MRFTPADGLVMGTYAGALDPEFLLYQLNEERMIAEHTRRVLGLCGVA